MPRKRKNSGSFYSNHVGNVEQTASGKFMVRARKRKIPTNEQEVTVETLESGKARLRKLEKLYLEKATVPLADVPDPQLHAADRARGDFYSRHKKAPKFKFGEVVAAGLEALRLKALREKLPTIKESIAWFHGYRRTPEAKRRTRSPIGVRRSQ